MRPSSRTPEGEPVRCPICGALQRVEVARPPGDSVCMSCGSHVWISDRERGLSSARSHIRKYVNDMAKLCHSSAPREQFGERLVTGMTVCLAAHGTMLWVAERRAWWTRKSQLRLIACDGKPDTPEFANEVRVAKKAVARIAESGKDLLIAAPIVRDGKVLGVIDVRQRPSGPPPARAGYALFIKQIAELAAESPVLLS